MKEDPNAELSRQEYWDKRYDTTSDNTSDQTYDWLRDFSTIRPFLEAHLPSSSSNPKILHCGNGNSTLPHHLESELNYTSHTAIDFSPIVTSSMSKLYPSIIFETMDIRSMTLPSSSFDVVIDKATLDAMLYGSLWDPLPEVKENVGKYVDEVARVLKKGGTWVYVTWRQPHFVKGLLEREGVWGVGVETIGGGEGMFEYFGFVMRKFGEVGGEMKEEL